MARPATVGAETKPRTSWAAGRFDTLTQRMTKFVVDASAVIHLVTAEIEVSGAHELLAPTLLRSQALSLLHEAVQRGEGSSGVARERLRLIGQMRIRVLGDAVLRRGAWEVAGQVGWDCIYNGG